MRLCRLEGDRGRDRAVMFGFAIEVPGIPWFQLIFRRSILVIPGTWDFPGTIYLYILTRGILCSL